MTRLCDRCAEPAVVFEPGSEAIRDLFLLKRDVPMRCWCIRHWISEFSQREVVIHE